MNEFWENYIIPCLHPIEDRRGKRQVANFGIWCEQGHAERMKWTPDSENEVGKKAIAAFQVVARRISLFIKEIFPGMTEEIYSEIPEKYRPFGCFSLMMAFDGTADLLHRDGNDVHGGFSAMISLGSFSGGNVLLQDPDLNINMEWKLKAGDLFVCRSHEIHHAGLPYEGERRLLIFVAHNNVYNNWANK